MSKRQQVLVIFMGFVGAAYGVDRPPAQCVYVYNRDVQVIERDCRNGIIALTQEEERALRTGRAEYCALERSRSGNKRVCR
jgi:hypothetical protein